MLADAARMLVDELTPLAESTGHRLAAGDRRSRVGARGRGARPADRPLARVNALTHTPPGTEIVLTTALRAGRAELAVSDDGPGIPREHAERSSTASTASRARMPRAAVSALRSHASLPSGWAAPWSSAERRSGRRSRSRCRRRRSRRANSPFPRENGLSHRRRFHVETRRPLLRWPAWVAWQPWGLPSPPPRSAPWWRSSSGRSPASAGARRRSSRRAPLRHRPAPPRRSPLAPARHGVRPGGALRCARARGRHHLRESGDRRHGAGLGLRRRP